MEFGELFIEVFVKVVHVLFHILLKLVGVEWAVVVRWLAIPALPVSLLLLLLVFVLVSLLVLARGRVVFRLVRSGRLVGLRAAFLRQLAGFIVLLLLFLVLEDFIGNIDILELVLMHFTGSVWVILVAEFIIHVLDLVLRRRFG